MPASNPIRIDGPTKGLGDAETPPTGGVVSNFWPLEGTGAGSTAQEMTELEISGRLDFSAAKKIMMPGASL